MSITNEVLEYRRKIDSLSPHNKRIWDLANRMMNEMMRSENADLQHYYSSSRRHGDASRKAQDELLELLAGAADVEKLAREIAPGWLVWSAEHNVWWRPDSNGYTTEIAKAGRYTLEQALACCAKRSARPDGRPNEVAVPSPELIEAVLRRYLQPPLPQSRDIRQKEVSEWCAAAFGADHASSVPQRGIRMLEEAIEAYQSATVGLPEDEMREKAHVLVDYVMGRLSGNLAQECGGVGLTLLALCESAGISAEAEELREIARVKSKPLEHFHARNQVKNEAGFAIIQPAEPPPPAKEKA